MEGIQANPSQSWLVGYLALIYNLQLLIYSNICVLDDKSTSPSAIKVSLAAEKAKTRTNTIAQALFQSKIVYSLHY